MSCTVLALPYALAWIVGSVIYTAITQETEIPQLGEFSNVVPLEATNIDSYNTDKIIEKNGMLNKACDDVNVIDAHHFIEKTFETPFTDKNLLIKTLEEHGVKNIHEDEFGKIIGVVDSYSLSFEKTEDDKPYYIKISCLETDNAEEKIGDLSSEYALNVQEEAYLNIVDKLKENNMEIEDEEGMEDNTIVLTINLE